MRADKFLYVFFFILQYVNGHAAVCFMRSLCFIIVSSVGVWFGEIFDNFAFFILKEYAVDIH